MASESSSSGTLTEPQHETPAAAAAQSSNEATIDSSALDGGGGTELSTCNTAAATTTMTTTEIEPEKSLEFAAELTEKGTKALDDSDFAEAADCFSRALEIKVSHFGELAPECFSAYYLYGKALLYKAQEEADPLVSGPKKEEEKEGNAAKSVALNGESSSVASAASSADGEGKKDQGEDGDDDDESEDEDLAEGDEDDSDLDLAWKMLDIARAISEKNSGDAMDKVDVLSALAEVALEREDIDTSLSDYQKATSILERLVEPDSRYLAELNFRICLCLELGCKPQEALPYCQNAISICKARLQRLMNEVKTSSGSAASSAVSELDEGFQQSSTTGLQTEKSVTEKEAEIETLTGLSGDLEKKLEDLQQLIQNPKSILSELLGLASVKASEKGASPAVMSPSQMTTIATGNSSGAFDSPTVSAAHTNGASGVTDLGVVGRGVKRVLMTAATAETSPRKKPSLEPSSDKPDGNAS